MALDGITVSCIKKEMEDKLTGGYIAKIAQPENDELVLSIKNKSKTYKLTISANPSLPLIYITDKTNPSPMTAPAFCMLLRKHISGGRVIDVIQPSLERVLILIIEHRNELGDLCAKKLIIELMGRHSNIIFASGEDLIIDSIKRIPVSISSVREVLPGRPYFIPQTIEKANPLELEPNDFEAYVFSKNCSLSTAIYTSLTGFSPMAAEEICFRASVDSGKFSPECSKSERLHIYHTFESFIDDIKNAVFSPYIYYKNRAPYDFSVFESSLYSNFEKQSFESVFDLLFSYYSAKESISRMRQKSSQLRKIVSIALDRNVKKLSLQQKQIKDTDKKNSFRLYGELLTAYGYSAKDGANKFETVDYHTGENISIPLNPQLNAIDNAKLYFEKYNKLKRTLEAVSVLANETENVISHLESIQTALESSTDEADLAQIKSELQDSGYIKKKSPSKNKSTKKARPLHFISSDGYHIYVGKNNYQNDEITFSTPYRFDWWFHSKGIPGSHVIVKSNDSILPDSTFEEAGRLAAYFCKGRLSPKVEIDYTLRRNIKKPPKAKPGFVIYYTNYSMMSVPDISGIQRLEI